MMISYLRGRPQGVHLLQLGCARLVGVKQQQISTAAGNAAYRASLGLLQLNRKISQDTLSKSLIATHPSVRRFATEEEKKRAMRVKPIEIETPEPEIIASGAKKAKAGHISSDGLVGKTIVNINVESSNSASDQDFEDNLVSEWERSLTLEQQSSLHAWLPTLSPAIRSQFLSLDPSTRKLMLDPSTRKLMLGLLNSSNASVQQQPSSTPTFEKFVDELKKKIPNLYLSTTDCSAAMFILGLSLSSNRLIGRSTEKSQIIHNVSFIAGFGRKSLNLISGIPGSGKTRMLFEVAKHFEQISCVVLTVSFNNQQSVTALEQEKFFSKRAFEVPIVWRLLNSYLARHIPAGTFLGYVVEVLDAFPALMNVMTINNCLAHLLTASTANTRTLLLIDECLRFLDINVSESDVESMMRAACVACDGSGRSVLFSAMASSFLNEYQTARKIETTTLPPLQPTDSILLIESMLGAEVCSKLSELSTRSVKDILCLLNAFAVSGLPRASEFLRQRLQDKEWTRCPIPLPFLITLVHSRLIDRYIVPWGIVEQAVLGVRKTWHLSDEIPKTGSILRSRAKNITVRDAVLRGWLPQPTSKSTSVDVFLPPALLLSTLLLCPYSTEVQLAARALAGLHALQSRNLWEEFVCRVIILRSNLLQVHSASADSSSGSAVASYTASEIDEAAVSSLAPVTNGGGRELTSYLQLFNNEAVHTGFLSKTKVVIAQPLSNIILQYARLNPPTPEELDKMPSLLSNIFVSESDSEPGVDALVFVRQVHTGALVAVGIQCKWSEEMATTKLDRTTIVAAHEKYCHTMVSRGWNRENLLLVFIAHRGVTNNVFEGEGSKRHLWKEAPKGTAVVGLDCGLQGWLGMSLMAVAEGIHQARHSHGPYKSYCDYVGGM